MPRGAAVAQMARPVVLPPAPLAPRKPQQRNQDAADGWGKGAATAGLDPCLQSAPVTAQCRQPAADESRETLTPDQQEGFVYSDNIKFN